MVATPDGDRSVHDFNVGDKVKVLSGGSDKIVIITKKKSDEYEGEVQNFDTKYIIIFNPLAIMRGL